MVARFLVIEAAALICSPVQDRLDGVEVMALTDSQIRALRPRDRIYKCTDERGLYLEVRPGGSKLWRFKYSHLGKDKRIALGRYPEVSLAAARRKRDEARFKLLDGTDPLAERKQYK